MPKPEKVTEEQAAQALQQLSLEVGDESEPMQAVQQVTETEPEPPAATETPAAGTETDQALEAAATTDEPKVAEGDDVASLKKRLEEKDKLFEARWKALQGRQAQNEQILRERFLRKATITDKALKILKATRSESGAPEADVDSVIREIESTMNPASASYVPSPSGEQVALDEDQAIVLNSFLNEQGMTNEEANKFGEWVRTQGATALSSREQAVAHQSLDGFLRIAHGRWQGWMRDNDRKTDDAVNAVQSVQRAQKEAARAAAASPTAPRKQPAAPKTGIDTKKLTPDDISALLRQSVEQYR